MNGTALHVAAACGNSSVVSALLNWGVDVDIADCVSSMLKDLVNYQLLLPVITSSLTTINFMIRLTAQ